MDREHGRPRGREFVKRLDFTPSKVPSTRRLLRNRRRGGGGRPRPPSGARPSADAHECYAHGKLIPRMASLLAKPGGQDARTPDSASR